MRLTTKISWALALLLLFALSGAGLSMWGGNRLSSLYHQSDLAHRSYQHYLSLSSRTYQLFKQLGDSLLLRERVIGQGERELLFYIKSELLSINRLVAEQKALNGDKADDEAQIAYNMARLIEAMVVDYQAVVRSINRSPNGTAWRKTARALDIRLDEEFEPLLATALAKAKFRAEAATAEEAALTVKFKQLALYFAILSSLATLFLILWIQRVIRSSLQRLVAGAEALEAGDTNHRLPLNAANPEFSAVAGAFNQMANKIDERQRGLGETNTQLGQAVEERTHALRAALKQVTQLDETRRQLLADVSHELRTPLTIVRAEADLALRGQEKTVDYYKESLRVSKAAAEHMTRLVEDLLFVAKAESKQVKLQRLSYDLVGQIGQLLPLAQHLGGRQTGQEQVTFECDHAEIFVDADRDRIRQVLMILVENALNYGEAPRSIKLQLQGLNVLLSVCNSGAVLSEEKQKMLFERFYRGSDSSKNYKGGAGLGLPVAKAIVAAHGSELIVESDSSVGTCLYFSLPLKGAEDAEEQ